MEPRNQSRVRLRIEELECRAVPAILTPIEVPGPAALLGDHAQIRSVNSAAAHAHDRPFHLKESGTAVINADGTISGSASGTATHLGAFTLQDTSTVVGAAVTPDGLVLQIEGKAELVAANGDKLYATLSGSVNMTTGKATLTFEWIEWPGGDGRFADASGATVWQLTLNPDLSYTAVADGVINY